MVALADLPPDKAVQVYERIRFNIEKLGQQLTKKCPDHPVTVSIGMDQHPPLNPWRGECAEICLYHASNMNILRVKHSV
jgi:GGDEF domain-containing protein